MVGRKTLRLLRRGCLVAFLPGAIFTDAFLAALDLAYPQVHDVVANFEMIMAAAVSCMFWLCLFRTADVTSMWPKMFSVRVSNASSASVIPDVVEILHIDIRLTTSVTSGLVSLGKGLATVVLSVLILLINMLTALLDWRSALAIFCLLCGVQHFVFPKHNE